MSMRALGLLLLLTGTAAAETPPWRHQPALQSSPTETVALPALDRARALADDAVDGKPVGEPPAIGLIARVDRIGTGRSSRAGHWSTLPDGRAVWRVAIDGPNALALDFGFSRFHLPAGAELWIRNADGSDWLGPYTDRDNPASGRLYTPRLRGTHAIIELLVPADRREFVELELDDVSRHYRELWGASLQKSGSCNVDVACPTGDPYREQIASVAHYTFRKESDPRTFVCTGQLAATTAPGNDASAPTFLTAHHCVPSNTVAQTMVFYWRYESPTCRTPGSAASGIPLSRESNTAATQSGASLLATHDATDFTVVRLAHPVPAAADARWSGWDRSGSTPDGSVTIHHPAGDEKRISINDDPLAITPNCILGGTAANTHWEVDNWEIGTTEGGSSGAGLWRPDSKRLIGVLSGGAASCATISYDCYGRLSEAWNGGGTPATRVRDWLDPAGTGQLALDPGLASTLSVSLASTAFETLPSAGQSITMTASGSGGSAPYSYAWDVDGDGVFDRDGSSAQVTLSYPNRTSTQVTVRITDADGVTAQDSRALDVAGPQFAALATGAPTQVCGNNDGKLDPGERWQLPVRLSNDGNASFAGGDALFAGDALLLPQPVRQVGALTVGGSTTINLPFAIAADSACGTPVSLEFIAAASAGVHDFDRSTLFTGAVGQGCAVVAGCNLRGPGATVLEGMHYDPARDANGLNAFFVPGDAGYSGFGGLWYTGLADRTPVWYLLTGPLYEYGGEVDVLRFVNTGAPGGFAPSGSSAGRAWVGWSADGVLLMAWELDGIGSGAERMERVPFGYSQPNHTAPWFYPPEDGWGLTIESLNLGGGSRLEFLAAFLYDAAGEPRWVVGSLPTVTGGVFAMSGYEPQCPACPRFADVQQRSTAAGTMQIVYPPQPNRATLDSSLSLPAPWSGSWIRNALPIVPIVDPRAATGQ